MLTVKEFINNLSKFSPDMEIVIADGDDGTDPFPCHFRMSKKNRLNETSGKEVVLIDYLRKFPV